MQQAPVRYELDVQSRDIYHGIYCRWEGLIVRQKAKVFTNGRSQAVRLPAAFRFDTKEVFIDRNPRNGDVILSRKPANWSEVFAALDRAGVPDNFLANRDRSLPQERETL